MFTLSPINPHERKGNGYSCGSSDARGDLGERHELQPVARRQDRDITCASLACAAAGDDGGLYWVHAEQPPNKPPRCHQRRNAGDDGHHGCRGKGGYELLPRRKRHANREEQGVGDRC